MGIKTGDQYLSGLRDGREVWLRGKRIEDVTSEPGLARGARTLATFLDKVHEPEQLEKLRALRRRLQAEAAAGSPSASAQPNLAGQGAELEADR